MQTTNDQAAVVDGVHHFVDNIAKTITETMNVAAEKVALEAAVVRQRYRFEAQMGVLQLIHAQRNQLREAAAASQDETERALIGRQMGLLQEQLAGVLAMAGVPNGVATNAAKQATTLEVAPRVAIAGPAKRRKLA